MRAVAVRSRTSLRNATTQRPRGLMHPSLPSRGRGTHRLLRHHLADDASQALDKVVRLIAKLWLLAGLRRIAGLRLIAIRRLSARLRLIALRLSALLRLNALLRRNPLRLSLRRSALRLN